jgi:flagellar biosynthesis protein FlhB
LAAENKSEKATVRRRQKARAKGQVARSRDLVSAFTLLTVTTAMAYESRLWIGTWRDFMARLLDPGSRPGIDLGTSVFSWTAITVAECIAPILLLGLAISFFSAAAQGGFIFAPEALTPQWNRLNPAANLGRIFSIAGMSRLLRSLIPGSAIVFIAYSLIQREMPEIARLAQLGSHQLLVRIASLWFELSWKCGLVLLAWSAGDYGFQRWSYERGLRMTKQEVREESKDNDGNPATRGRRRNIRRALFKKIIAKQIARATAVITNPTHYAVAIEYRPESMSAPVVVAKGRNLLAARIRQLARWHEIPIIENPPLAQALYKMAEVGQSIPPQLYAAVAEILAFLYRAQRRLQGAQIPLRRSGN